MMNISDSECPKKEIALPSPPHNFHSKQFSQSKSQQSLFIPPSERIVSTVTLTEKSKKYAECISNFDDRHDSQSSIKFFEGLSNKAIVLYEEKQCKSRPKKTQSIEHHHDNNNQIEYCFSSRNLMASKSNMNKNRVKVKATEITMDDHGMSDALQSIHDGLDNLIRGMVNKKIIDLKDKKQLKIVSKNQGEPNTSQKPRFTVPKNTSQTSKTQVPILHQRQSIPKRSRNPDPAEHELHDNASRMPPGMPRAADGRGDVDVCGYGYVTK